jgi:anti-sigma factor (TIGR02949 family)
MSDRATHGNHGGANGSASARAARSATRAWVAAAALRLGVTEATVRRWIRSGRLNPSCREVYSHVFPFLDHELTAEQRAEVERHIAACPGCEEHFGFDGSVLRFVRQRVPRPMIQSDLQERLLGRFRGRSVAES